MDRVDPFFSICIPAYNRSRYLEDLLNSILDQDFHSYEIVICEDNSSERSEISRIAKSYEKKFPGKIKYFENQSNIGYDANIRNLVEKSRGAYCFFMGNDDLMCSEALSKVFKLVNSYPKVGMVLKSYAWFDGTPEKVNQEVRYFSDERLLEAGEKAISVCFRRSGVISGYIIKRVPALQAATDEFDGTLYYQMHLTASVLMNENAVSTPMVLVKCRDGEPPEFGNSDSEKGKYTPGRYTPAARLSMIDGAISIAKVAEKKSHLNIVDPIMLDYANYFYPYIKDQLKLPIGEYLGLYIKYSKIGFFKYPMFHLYMLLCYLMGEKIFDALTLRVRKRLGRSPHFGFIKQVG